MKISPYITLDGEAALAIKFYQAVFETKEPQIMLFGDIPPDSGYSPATEEEKKRVMHAEIDIDGCIIYFSDTPANMPVSFGKQHPVSIAVSESKSKIETYYNRLKEGGEIIMELQQTFWSPAYALVTDKFGIMWQLSAE